MNIEPLHSHIPIVTDTDCNPCKPIFKTVIEGYKNHQNFCRYSFLGDESILTVFPYHKALSVAQSAIH